jgi:hypothetical protein
MCVLLAGEISAFAVNSYPTSLRVIVLDPNGAVITSSRVQIKTKEGEKSTLDTNQSGEAVFAGLKPGKLQIHIEANGFIAHTLDEFILKPGSNQIEIRLQVAGVEEKLVVQEDVREKKTDPRGDGFTTILTEDQIADLPDDPEELEAALKRIAGPGAVIRVNGFTGGRLPLKSQIKQIRFRRNSYTAEYHESGLTGIDIMTRPGTDTWHASLGIAFRDEKLDARNAFAPRRGPQQLRRFNLTLDIPLWRDRTSLFLAGNSNDFLDSQTIIARLPSGSLADIITRPTYGLHTSARMTHAVSKTNTLTVSYERNGQRKDNLGVGNFDLTDRAYSLDESEHLFRVSDSSIIKRRLFNEFRLQARFSDRALDSATDSPAIIVLNAFNKGGAQKQSHNAAQEVEIADNVDLASGRHAIRTGFLLETNRYNNDSFFNKGGTFTFASLADFSEGHPITFTQRVGHHPIEFTQYQLGLYIQDDIRLYPSVTLSVGLRYERQNNLDDESNFAPRLGFAWSPFKDGRTTIRGGAGLFYGWFTAETFGEILSTNGQQQLDVIVSNPGFPDPFASGTRVILPPSRLQRASDLLNPYILQSSLGMERELASRTFLRIIYLYQRGHHLLRGHNINAARSEFGRPDPGSGNVIQVESIADSWKHMLYFSLNGMGLKRLYWLFDYSFSRATNETDGPVSLPADNYDLRAERGPSSEDFRHRLFASIALDLFKGMRLSTMFYANSGLPYNITTGHDDNGDTIINDRPVGVGRNSARGAPQWGLNLHLGWTRGFGKPGRASQAQASRTVRVSRSSGGAFASDLDASEKRWVINPYAQVFNLLNHVSFTNYTGVQTSPFFRKATAALPGRRIELGLRFSF